MQSLRPLHSAAPKSPSPPSPIILVTDYTQLPPITTHYINGDNTLDFRNVYTTIKSLLTHPPCTHHEYPGSWPCGLCDFAFLSTYWTSAAHLLDYFADFLAHDTALMCSLWFHLFDVFQETHLWLPYTSPFKDPPRISPQTTALSAAQFHVGCFLDAIDAELFLKERSKFLALVDGVLHGPKEGRAPTEKIVHSPDGEVKSPVAGCNTGPWLSGLSAWQQFLCAGSPGVDGCEELDDNVRYVPMAAIGIIKTHTERARRLALGVSSDVEFLHAFEKNCLVFPAGVEAPSHSYRSIEGKDVTYRLVNGAPPIVRHAGYGDPAMACSNETFTMLDDCVGLCRGIEPYEPVSGEPKDDADESDEDEEDAFDMWAVYQSRESPGGIRTAEVAEG
jgi:hypothetical protein